jgi:hypothetical protein
MNDWPQTIVLLVLAGLAVTVLGSAAIWLMDEERRIRRELKRVLKDAPEAMIVAPGRGRGAGFNFTTGLVAVAWDAGRWLLVYRLDELAGAELIVDGQVLAKAYRGEPRRGLDQPVEHAARVTLRLIFDDPHYPEFDLDLWLAGDENRRKATSPADAAQEASQWINRAEAVLRRPVAPKSNQASLLRRDDDDLDDEPPFHLGDDERLI